MHSEIRTAFILSGPNVLADEITATLGTAPTKTWKIGDPFDPRASPLRADGGWQLDSGLPPSAELERQVRELRRLLEPAQTALAGLCARHDAMLSCAIYSYEGDRPAIHLDRDLVRFFAELNASIDIDLYVL